MDKKTRLRVTEFVCLFAFLSTRLFVEYYAASVWVGVAVTSLFGALYGLLYFRRMKYPRKRFILELAIGIPLVLTFIYVAFFLK